MLSWMGASEVRDFFVGGGEVRDFFVVRREYLRRVHEENIESFGLRREKFDSERQQTPHRASTDPAPSVNRPRTEMIGCLVAILIPICCMEPTLLAPQSASVIELRSFLNKYAACHLLAVSVAVLLTNSNELLEWDLLEMWVSLKFWMGFAAAQIFCRFIKSTKSDASWVHIARRYFQFASHVFDCTATIVGAGLRHQFFGTCVLVIITRMSCIMMVYRACPTLFWNGVVSFVAMTVFGVWDPFVKWLKRRIIKITCKMLYATARGLNAITAALIAHRSGGRLRQRSS